MVHLYSVGIIGRLNKVVNKAYKIYTKGTSPAIRKCSTMVAYTTCTNSSNIHISYIVITQPSRAKVYIISHTSRDKEGQYTYEITKYKYKKIEQLDRE